MEARTALEQFELTCGAARMNLEGVEGQIALARRCLGLPGVIEPSDGPVRRGRTGDPDS